MRSRLPGSARRRHAPWRRHPRHCRADHQQPGRPHHSVWTIDAAQLREVAGFETVCLVNDFEAMAWSLPALGASDLFPLGKQRAVADAPMLAVGPGTGFGVSCFSGRVRRPMPSSPKRDT